MKHLQCDHAQDMSLGLVLKMFFLKTHVNAIKHSLFLSVCIKWKLELRTWQSYFHSQITPIILLIKSVAEILIVFFLSLSRLRKVTV